jgi:hypothetical protein
MFYPYHDLVANLALAEMKPLNLSYLLTDPYLGFFAEYTLKV